MDRYWTLYLQELFAEHLAQEAFKHAQANKRKTLNYAVR
jgi:histone H3/H4